MRGGSEEERGGLVEVWTGDDATRAAEERGGRPEDGGRGGDEADGVWGAAETGADAADERPYVDIGVESSVPVLGDIYRDQFSDAFSEFSLITWWITKLVFRERKNKLREKVLDFVTNQRK